MIHHGVIVGRRSRGRYGVTEFHVTFRAFTCCMMLGAAPYAAHGDWIVGAEADLRHDNNVGNAQYASDITADSALRARLSMFQLFPLDENYSATLGGTLGGEAFHRLTGLDNTSVELAAALKRKWGLGAFAPWARAGISLGRSDYDDGYRNAWVYRATLASGRRVDERWNLSADYAYERRAARAQMEEVPGLSGDAYSQESHNVALNLDYALHESVSLGLSLLGRHGDVVSTTEPSATIFYGSRALAPDPTFGDEDYAYRLLGTTYGFRAAIHWSPTSHSLLGAGFTRLETRATGGNNYGKSIPEITWNYGF